MSVFEQPKIALCDSFVLNFSGAGLSVTSHRDLQHLIFETLKDPKCDHISHIVDVLHHRYKDYNVNVFYKELGRICLQNGMLESYIDMVPKFDGLEEFFSIIH